MHRRVITWALLLIVGVAVCAPAVHGETLRQQVQVYITSPEMGQVVTGLVEIRGSALVPSFQFYKVEFGMGPNPTQWAVIGSLHYQPVINDRLELWDTTVVPDGVYTLRLQGVKQDGNWEEFIVRQLEVANTRPTPTPTPTETATPIPATPTPTVEAPPEATPTPHVIGPGVVPTRASQSPTPTLSRPDLRERLPIDPQGWAQSFCFGGVAMAVVFALLGIVFGVRRLL